MSVTLSEFVLTDRKQTSPFRECLFAQVTVTTTTGMWPFKRTTVERREIAKDGGTWWFFTDTGKHTPDSQAEELARAYEARELRAKA
jgi:hypothetical protein